MNESPGRWGNKPHDWASTVDVPRSRSFLITIRTSACPCSPPSASGSWTQRYEHGILVTDLLPVNDNITAGSTIHFVPEAAMTATGLVPAATLTRLANRPSLNIAIVDENDARVPGR